MEMQFHWTEADYVSANWAFQKRHWWPFVYGYRFPVCMCVVGLTFIFLRPESYLSGASILAVGIGLIIYIAVGSRWAWQRQFRKARGGQRLISASVDGDSICMRGTNYALAKQWSELTDIYESRRAFIFGTSKGGILVIPKTSLNQLQLSELRSMIFANAKGKVRLASA